MARKWRRVAAILDADVVGNDESTTARLAEHHAQSLEPVLTRHGGRLLERTGDGARAEFPSAVEALGAAIEFQYAMADATRGQPEDAAVVIRLGLRLGGGIDGDRVEEPVRAGRIVVSAPVRDALAGRVKASFAELGGAGLGTVDRPVRAYEVGWDPADWPAASAVSATPVAPPGDGKRMSRWLAAIAAGVLLAGAGTLVFAPRPPPSLAGLRVPGGEGLERLQLERRAEAAIARWQRDEQDEPGDEPANPDNAPPADAYDGLYTGMATMRAEGRVVTFKVKVANGVGSGTQSRLDCGTAPLSLRISPSGTVSGMVLIFGSTCLKTELAIRGRAIGGTLRLTLGSQYMELAKQGD